MSGSTGGAGPDGLDVLALGVDSSKVERGVAQAKAALGTLEGAAEKAASAWDGMLDALGDTAARAQQAQPAMAGIGRAAGDAEEKVKRLARETWEQARAMTEYRSAAIAASQELTTIAAQAHRAATAQKEFNEAFRAPTRGGFAEIGAYANALDQLRQKYNPLYAAAQQYRAQFEDIRRAHAIGAINAQEMAAAQERLRAATKAQVDALRNVQPAAQQAAGGLQLAGHQMTNLSYQIQDAAVQLSMGQNPLMILMQQGPQASAAVGGVGNAWRMLLQVMTPTNVALGAAALALGAFVAISQRSASVLGDLRTQLRATRDDYTAMSQVVSEAARNVGGTSGISTSDARQAGLALVGARGFSGTQQDVERLTRLSADLARVMGKDVPEAAAVMAKAIADPAGVARDLAQSGMYGFNDVLRRNVEQLVAQGQKAEATRLLMDQYARRVQGAADDVTGLTRAWRAVTGAIDSAFDALGRFMERQERQARRSGSDRMDEFGFYYPRPGETATTAPRGGGLVGGTIVTEGLAVLSRRDATSREIETAVREQAAAMGIDVGFAAGIARRESTFRQYGPDGRVLTSPAGARGIMQVMPDTFQEMLPGGNIDDPIHNVIAGLRYLQQMLRAANGDQSLAAAAYNAGPGRVNQFLRNGRPLPDETLRYVQEVGATGALAGGAGAIGRADSVFSGQDFRSDRMRILQGQQRTLTDALGAPGLDQAGEAATRYREALEKVRAEIESLEKPTERMARQQQQQAELYRTGAGAARDLAAAEQQAREAAKAAGASEADQVLAGITARETRQRELLGQLNDYIEQQGRSTEASQAEAAAILSGADAMAKVADQRRAEVDALKYAATGTVAYQEAVRRLTELYQEQRAALADQATARQAIQSQQQIDYLKAEIALVGESVQVRERELAALRQRQDIQARGGNPDSEVSQISIARVRQVADLRGELQRSQSAFQELATIGEQAFNRIGSAITQGLANGTLSTIKFGNIFKAMNSEIIQQFARLSMLNPILNSLFGRNLPTLGDVGGALRGVMGISGAAASPASLGGFGGWGGAGLSNTSLGTGGLTILGGAGGSAVVPAGAGGGGLFGNIGSVSNILSFGSKAWNFISGGAQGLANSLNPGTWGITNSLGLGGFFNAPLWGSATAVPASQMGLGSAEALMAAMPGSASPAASSLGSLLGSFGLGMGAGSLASMAVGGIRGTAEPWGGMAGSAIGAGIGAIFGPVGAIVGGLIGGGGGAMFGPTKKGMAQRAGGTVSVGISDGGLVITGAGGKRWDEAGARAEIQEELDRLNQGFQSRGFYFGGDYSSRVGFGQAAARAGETMAFDPFSVRGALRSNNPNLQTILRTTQATSVEGLFSDADFVTGEYEPALKKLRDSTDSFTIAVRRLDEEYGPIADRARALGLATEELIDGWFKQRGRLFEERDLALSSITTNLDVRLARLNKEGEQGDLLAYDQQAREEAFNLRKRLEDLGQAAWQVTGTMAKLAEVQARERDAIVKARQEAAAGVVGGTVVSMADYARNLRTSDASPLSAQAQFSMASADFDRIVGGIEGGKWSDTSRLTAYADTLLGTARNLYGSGTSYVEVFNRVLAAMEKVAATPAEQLTAQVLREETRTQTDVMKQALQRLTDEVTALRREVAQGTAMPARLAA